MGIPTTTEEQYARLRSYLTPAIKGPNADAILTALAAGPASYLINSIAAVNDQLYIATASGQYLDERLAQYGITRPPAIGLSDEVFSQIGILVKNRKQVRDLINKLLDVLFGDEFVRAADDAAAVEPYDLNDGDTLVIRFDDNFTANISFNASQFSNINAASAQEVADAITVSLRDQGLTGTAIAKNDGNGNFVEILSDTIGPASSVTILGGSAQNQLQFPAAVSAGGNMSTQWTVSLQPGGFIRFTWSGGANPQLGKVSVGNYVNIFGGGFASSDNEGSYTITEAVGGAVNASYFQFSNPLGTPGIVTQGSDTAVLFYNPVRKTVISRISYAAVFQTASKVLQVFLPASTKVIKRDRIGSAHIHYPPLVSYTFNAQPAPNDIFTIATGLAIQAGVNFAIGSSIDGTIANMVEALPSSLGVTAYANANVLTVFQNSTSLNMTGTYSGSANIVANGLQGDPVSLQSNQQGPYGYDLTQAFTLSSTITTLAQELDSTQPKVFQVADATQFPNAQGYIVIGYGTQQQEGPIPYIARPSDNTLLISPAYTLKNMFQPGTEVQLIAYKGSVVVTQDGRDYPFYVTDVASGREYAQTLINEITATGINLVITVLYPSDIGLGKAGTKYSEIAAIWGP